MAVSVFNISKHRRRARLSKTASRSRLKFKYLHRILFLLFVYPSINSTADSSTVTITTNRANKQNLKTTATPSIPSPNLAMGEQGRYFIIFKTHFPFFTFSKYIPKANMYDVLTYGATLITKCVFY